MPKLNEIFVIREAVDVDAVLKLEKPEVEVTIKALKFYQKSGKTQGYEEIVIDGILDQIERGIHPPGPFDSHVPRRRLERNTDEGC